MEILINELNDIIRQKMNGVDAANNDNQKQRTIRKLKKIRIVVF